MDNKLERMLIMQGGNQRETYGYAFNEMSVDALIQYVRDQHQAAVMELGEALDEVSWKPWAQGSWIHRDEFVNELIDVLHFWLNMVLAVGGKSSAQELADEIFTRFALKNRTNTQRQVDGYDGRSTKCGGCGRALDDLAVECRRVGDQGYCAKLDSNINYLKYDPTLDALVPSTGPKEIKPIKYVCPWCQGAGESCYAAETDRWGWCGADQRQLPPIKLPTGS